MPPSSAQLYDRQPAVIDAGEALAEAEEVLVLPDRNAIVLLFQLGSPPSSVVPMLTFAPSTATSTTMAPPPASSRKLAARALRVSTRALRGWVHGFSSGTNESQPGITFTLSTASSRVPAGPP